MNTATTIDIEHVTAAQFATQLEQNWPHITEGVSILQLDAKPNSRLIMWADEGATKLQRLSLFSWVQVDAEMLRVEVTNEGNLVEQFLEWVQVNFLHS